MTANFPAFNIPRPGLRQKRRLYEQSDALPRRLQMARHRRTRSRLKYQMNLAQLRMRHAGHDYVVNLRALGLVIRRCAAIAP